MKLGSLTALWPPWTDWPNDSPTVLMSTRTKAPHTNTSQQLDHRRSLPLHPVWEQRSEYETTESLVFLIEKIYYRWLATLTSSADVAYLAAAQPKQSGYYVCISAPKGRWWGHYSPFFSAKITFSPMGVCRWTIEPSIPCPLWPLHSYSLSYSGSIRW